MIALLTRGDGRNIFGFICYTPAIYSKMRDSIFVLGLCLGLSDSLRLREGFRSLRAQESDVLSCPGGFIATNSPLNSIARMRTDSDGRTVFLYTCNRGYVASLPDAKGGSPRQFTVQCRNDSSGNVTAPTQVTCVRGSCNLDALSNIQHATLTVSNGSIPIDSSVTIECNAGYTIDGVSSGPQTRQLTCDQDTQLTPVYVDNDCKPVSCGSLTVPSDSQIVRGQEGQYKKKLFYGDVVELRCNEGFFFKPPSSLSTGLQTFSLTCNEMGNVVSLEDPTALVPGVCSPLHCGVIPRFNGSDPIARPTATVGIGDVVQYVCDRGASFVNSTGLSTVPVSKNHWTNSISSMIPKITHFGVNCVYDKIQEAAVYDTDPAIARCETELCPFPNIQIPPSVVLLSNSNISTSVYHVGDKISFACAPGYAMKGQSSGEFEAVCDAEKKDWIFEESFDACELAKCKPVSEISKNLINNMYPPRGDVILSVGESIETHCEEGFVSEFSLMEKNHQDPTLIEIFCNKDATFSASGKCVKQCGPLPSVPLKAVASIADGSEYVAGNQLVSSVKFSCVEGHSVDGNFVNSNNTVQNLFCSSSFLSSVQSLKACQPVQCGLPPSLPNATWFQSNPVNQYFSGQSLNYTCNPGYGVLDSISEKKVVAHSIQGNCTDNGWRYSSPQNGCSLVTCPSDPHLGNGKFVPAHDASILVGESIEFECDPGFAAPSDIVKLTCTDSGDYSPSNYGTDMCKPIVCPPLPASILGGAKPSNVHSLSYGDQPIEFLCNPDWNLPPIKVSCNQDGTYLIDGAACVEPYCDSFPAQILKNSVPAGPVNASLHTIMSVGCAPGFTASDLSIRYQVECLGPGTWKPLNPAYSTGCSLTSPESEPIVVR